MSEKTNEKKRPDLYFGPSSTPEGFTSAGVQGFSDLNPASIVREFIQNSLDAVREDGRTKARVRFEIEEIELVKIPAIESYRAAFDSAKQDQAEFQGGKLSDQAAMVVDAISDCLIKEKVEVLSVLDNGLGLNKKRMTGLLSDGMSVKSSAGSGAVGNGHLTAIPASDLRYVLYGGVSSDDGKIASGHAILASYALPDDTRSGKDGHYTTSLNDSMSNPYDFPSGKFIASLIKEKLEWIVANSDSKTGAAVIIPGFNRFREADRADLWEIIKKAAACNFFAAITDGHLEVSYKDSGREKNLTKSNLKEFFSGNISSEKRSKNFLSGSRAADAYTTAMEGDKHFVDVGCGTIEIRLRAVTSGLSRIDLCRNGMWITDRLPHLDRGKFSDRRPFQCLIKVTSQDGEIHQLIRKSEGPLHNHIEANKWLQKAERDQLYLAFNRVSTFLSNHLEILQEEEYRDDNFLPVVSREGVLTGGRRGERVGNFEEMPPRRTRTPNIEGEDGPGGPRERGKPNRAKPRRPNNGFKKQGNSVSFGAVPVPSGKRSYNIELFSQEDMASGTEAEIRFVLDESIDETCDPTNDEQFVKLKNIKLNNKKVSQSSLVRSEDAILGVRLGQFQKGKNLTLSFDYDLPGGIEGDTVVLRAEVVRRKVEA